MTASPIRRMSTSFENGVRRMSLSFAQHLPQAACPLACGMPALGVESSPILPRVCRAAALDDVSKLRHRALGNRAIYPNTRAAFFVLCALCGFIMLIRTYRSLDGRHDRCGDGMRRSPRSRQAGVGEPGRLVDCADLSDMEALEEFYIGSQGVSPWRARSCSRSRTVGSRTIGPRWSSTMSKVCRIPRSPRRATSPPAGSSARGAAWSSVPRQVSAQRGLWPLRLGQQPIARLFHLTPQLSDVDADERALPLPRLTADEDRVHVAGVHAEHDRAVGVVEWHHVDRVRAQQDDVGFLAGCQRADLALEVVDLRPAHGRNLDRLLHRHE